MIAVNGTETAQKIITRIAVAAGLSNILVPACVLVYAGATGTDYRYLFWDADTAVNWFSSVQLTLVAIAAYINFEIADLLRRRAAAHAGRSWIWLVFSLGFLFLACDEQFELHDMLTAELLAPSKVFSWVPFIQEGDVVLYFYLAAGLAFACYLVDELRRVRAALWYFILAVVLAAMTVIVDSLGWPVVKKWPLQGFWTSLFEETGELWAQYLFLFSFLTMIKSRLGLLEDKRS